MQEEYEARGEQGVGQRRVEPVVLAESAPQGRRNGAGKAAQREDEAGNEDQVVQLAG